MGSAKLGLGTAQLGMDYGIANRTGQPNPDEAFRLLEFAMHHQVTLWDTSPVYGTSEQILGQFLSHSDHTPQICTKLPSFTESGLTNDRTQLYDWAAQHLDRSLEALGVQHVDYYLIHDERDFESFGPELLEILTEFQERGVLKHVGLSVYSPSVALAALEDEPIEAIQIPLSLFEHRFSDVLATASEKEVSVFARSVFLQGLFFLEADNASRRVPDAVPYLEALRQLVRSAGRSTDEMALCYVRDRPEVSHVVVGVESVAQLRTDVRLFSRRPLSSELRLEIETLFSRIPVDVLNPSLWE